jgi:hypothetical protein
MAAVLTSVAGGLFWAVLIAGFPNSNFSFLAVVLGFCIGAMVRYFGRSNRDVYGFVAIAATMLGCLVATTLGGLAMLAHGKKTSVSGMLAHHDWSLAGAYQAIFSPIDVVFYALALFVAFRFASVVENY